MSVVIACKYANATNNAKQRTGLVLQRKAKRNTEPHQSKETDSKLTLDLLLSCKHSDSTHSCLVGFDTLSPLRPHICKISATRLAATLLVDVR